MKIATWNIERLKYKNSVDIIVNQCNNKGADILVLTETDSRIKPDYKNYISTNSPFVIDSTLYGETENRVSIYTDFPCVKLHETYDKYTSICAELETLDGCILVYGTIVGVYGNRHSLYKRDLLSQMGDIKKLSKLGKPICMCGDFNMTFCDNYYYTKEGRGIFLEILKECNLSLLTEDVAECVDHIAVSKKLLGGKALQITEWNQEKTLSDHKGIMVEF